MKDWIAAFTENRCLVCELRPRQRSAEVGWSHKILLPADRCRMHFGLFMEEYEMRAHDIVHRLDYGKVEFVPRLKQRVPMFS